MKRNLQEPETKLNTQQIMTLTMHDKLLFNSDIEEEKIQIILGNNTNLLVLEDTKFEWAVKLYDAMVNVRWTKEDVSMIDDPTTYTKLTENEIEAYGGTLCFLVFLDSLQVNNVGSNVSAFITAPEVVLCFAEQTAIEGQHSYIYQHIFQSLKLKREEILKIYYKYEDIPELKERNDYIAGIYQDFADDRTLIKYIRALIADLLLEGLYFYNGFLFFYSLAARGLVMGTSGNIKLINKDELFHTIMYQQTMKEILQLMDDDAKLAIYEIIFEMTDVGINQEIEWATLMYGDGKILGFTNMSINEYTHYLAFTNIIEPVIHRALLTPELMIKYDKLASFNDPYKHISSIANLEGGEAKGGFFENSNVDYLTVAVFDDFNSL